LDVDQAYIDELSIATEEDKLVPEIWELTIPGRVCMHVHLPGGVVREIAGEGIGQRMRMTTYDRKVAQEVVRDPNNDPFINGMLVRVDIASKKVPKTPNELDDAALAEIFKLDDDDFVATLDTLTEVNVRRLKAMCRKAKATTVQAEAINDLIAAKWKIGGDTPSNKEARGD
jgi:ABC-type ATPase with predicted acetyltransferase domain